MKKRKMPAFIIFVGWLALFPGRLVAEQAKYTVSVVYGEAGEYNDVVYKGIREGLLSFGDEYDFTIYRLYDENVDAPQLLQNIQEQHPDLIYAIGTEAARLLISAIDDIPIIFTAVPHPVAEGLVPDWQSSGRNMTGISCWVPVEETMADFRLAVPSLKRLGVLYDPGDPVAVEEIRSAQELPPAQAVGLLKAEVSSKEALPEAFQSLVAQHVDAVWIPRDKLVYENMELLLPLAVSAHVPLLSSSRQGVQGGAIAGVSLDYESLGWLTVPMALAIFSGEKTPEEIPIERMPRHRIMVNLKAARDIGYQLPVPVIAIAHDVIGLLSGQLVIPGTGDSQSLMRALAERFEEIYPGVGVEVPESVGSSGGIKAVILGKADVARAARPFRKHEEGHGLVQKAFALCPVVFVMNPGVSGVESLTTEEIVGIYSGKIRRWEDLGGKGKIYVINREPGDAGLRVIKKELPEFQKIGETAGKIISSTPKAKRNLIEHAKTIGYLPVAEATGTGLRVLKLNGIDPSAENVHNGSYPLVETFSVVYREDQASELLKEFVRFLYSEEGRKIISASGAVPLDLE